MSRGSLPIEQVLTLLAETPQRIRELTAIISPELLRSRPAAAEWSANDVLAHLRSCADVWGRCIATMLAGDHPAIRAINPTTWINQTGYPELDFQPNLQAFIEQRTQLLALLEALPPSGWFRAATVTGAGRPLERTVLTYAQWMARHERPHIKQIARIVTRLPDQ